MQANKPVTIRCAPGAAPLACAQTEVRPARRSRHHSWQRNPTGRPGGSAHERVRGFLVLIEQGDHLLLDNVAVDPATQGRGHGRALMDYAEGYARWAGLPAIRLYTQDIMVENIAIYSRRGYVETHRATEHGLRRIHMEKRL
ncbi:MAG TPA: GNAT family N-acetyltransferase [Paracoccus sp. (in: a-proteobacteria)]|nr:GNAT family N-acetyltransferase [Paracoccus sp. (in: a-proteobacteria)]